MPVYIIIHLLRYLKKRFKIKFRSKLKSYPESSLYNYTITTKVINIKAKFKEYALHKNTLTKVPAM